MRAEDITSGARAVAHLAEYFQELRQAAAALIGQARAGKRGYFTPSEEEAVRQLQISYWQARSALFEVVISFRDDAELPEAQRPAAFLVAYTAAVLLVDAARFLRESFEPLPMVREKLNEPEPSFGIPKGTYDTVQKSLTSTRHAWHLYHATRYYDEHQGELRALGSDPLLAAVLAVIDRLEHRVRVPATRFFKAKVRVRSRRAVGRVQHGLLGRAQYGIEKLAGCLAAGVFTRPGHRPRLPDGVADALRAELRPGDVLLTRKEYAVTNYFLPGYFKHAALYLGDPAAIRQLGIEGHENVGPRWAKLLADDEPDAHRVLEAMKDGVLIRSTASPFTADAIVVIRPRLGAADVAAALARGLFHEGKRYDFDFDFTRSDRLVCTEVAYRSYDGVGDMAFTLTPRAGRLTLSAEDLIDMALKRQHFEPAAVFVPGRSSRLVIGDQVEAVLRATRDSA